MVSKRSDENYIIMQYLGLNLEQFYGEIWWETFLCLLRIIAYQINIKEN